MTLCDRLVMIRLRGVRLVAEYTIGELVSLSGVNRRNVHFYVQQGLVPPPQGAGLGARYSDEHLLCLRAIPVLRKRGLRLDEIRKRLASSTARSIEAFLAEAPPQHPLKSSLGTVPAKTKSAASCRYTRAGSELSSIVRTKQPAHR